MGVQNNLNAISSPYEHKTAQARILEYTEAICWTIVTREEAEKRRGFDADTPLKVSDKSRSLFFDHWENRGLDLSLNTDN